MVEEVAVGLDVLSPLSFVVRALGVRHRPLRRPTLQDHFLQRQERHLDLSGGYHLTALTPQPPPTTMKTTESWLLQTLEQPSWRLYDWLVVHAPHVDVRALTPVSPNASP